ncbi:hypothetical protein EYF80_045540 [Liparis tanakae]|uniref:Uncharacterized protein n=1 Tax=Liparis tanakae TaxID=230148 RepID=A0A4Z2FSQ7_9TELE|nr:hypothetical protein EYF80_045540 [Liparis tanakae]
MPRDEDEDGSPLWSPPPPLGGGVTSDSSRPAVLPYKGSPFKVKHLTWVVVDQGWGHPSVGAPAALAHRQVRRVGGVLVLDVGLLGGHGRRHPGPGVLGLFGQNSHRILIFILQLVQSVRILQVDGRREIVYPGFLVICAHTTSCGGHLGPGRHHGHSPLSAHVGFPLLGLLPVL